MNLVLTLLFPQVQNAHEGRICVQAPRSRLPWSLYSCYAFVFELLMPEMLVGRGREREGAETLQARVILTQMSLGLGLWQQPDLLWLQRACFHQLLPVTWHSTDKTFQEEGAKAHLHWPSQTTAVRRPASRPSCISHPWQKKNPCLDAYYAFLGHLKLWEKLFRALQIPKWANWGLLSHQCWTLISFQAAHGSPLCPPCVQAAQTLPSRTGKADSSLCRQPSKQNSLWNAQKKRAIPATIININH